MRYLDYTKKFTNFDTILILFDELGFTDDETMSKLEVSKQTLYNARARQESLNKAISAIESVKALQFGNPDINTVTEAFKTYFGTTSVSKFDRFAAKRLSERHKANAVVSVIKALSQYGGEQFAPSINSVLDLEKKWPSVAKFLNGKISDQPMDL